MLSLEEVAVILCQKIFAGAEFGGKEKAIRDEVPAVFIDRPFMGLRVILMGYSGLEEDKGFTVSIEPSAGFGTYLYLKKIEEIRVDMDDYLYHLFAEALQGNSDIQVLKP